RAFKLLITAVVVFGVIMLFFIGLGAMAGRYRPRQSPPPSLRPIEIPKLDLRPLAPRPIDIPKLDPALFDRNRVDPPMAIPRRQPPVGKTTPPAPATPR